MDAWSCLRRAVVAAVALVAAVGCTSEGAATVTSPTTAVTTPATPAVTTPTSASPTAQTGSPSPTETWSPDQAAAIDALAGFSAADDRIGADPSAFSEKEMTEILQEFSGGEALKATVRSHLDLRENGYRFVGAMVILQTLATEAVDDGHGLEVHVTQCQDQREGKVVDKDGNPVPGDQYQVPPYNLRQYSVRKPPGENAFRVFGFQTISGRCP